MTLQSVQTKDNGVVKRGIDRQTSREQRRGSFKTTENKKHVVQNELRLNSSLKHNTTTDCLLNFHSNNTLIKLIVWAEEEASVVGGASPVAVGEDTVVVDLLVAAEACLVASLEEAGLLRQRILAAVGEAYLVASQEAASEVEADAFLAGMTFREVVEAAFPRLKEAVAEPTWGEAEGEASCSE